MDTKTASQNKTGKMGGMGRAAGLAAALGLLLAAGAYADDPLAMAPPIEGAYSSDGGATDGGGPVSAAQDSVFQWTEVPQNQQVPIRRAVFDQGGYQLYDEKGETIVVPFTNHNLYAMKFAPSDNGSFYFINDGDAPVLYVPQNGFLENAGVPGARWYPFSEQFHPSHPVFLGIAPSYEAFCDMGWYSDMRCHGGYYCDGPFVSVDFFRPTFGLFFVIGGHHYDGWDHYHDYCDYHPAPYHVTIVNNNIYNNNYNENRYSGVRGSYPGGPWRPLGGNGYREGSSHTFGQGRVYTGRLPDNGHTFGAERPLLAHRTFGGSVHTLSGARSFGGDRAVSGGGHSFQGARPSGEGSAYGADRTFGSGRAFGDGHTSGGGRIIDEGRATEGTHFPSGGRTFEGSGRPASASADRPFSSGRAFSGGSRAYSSGNPGRTYNDNGGGRTYGSSNGGSRAYGNGGGRAPSNGGGNASEGGHSFGSGYRPR